MVLAEYTEPPRFIRILLAFTRPMLKTHRQTQKNTTCRTNRPQLSEYEGSREHHWGSQRRYTRGKHARRRRNTRKRGNKGETLNFQATSRLTNVRQGQRRRRRAPAAPPIDQEPQRRLHCSALHNAHSPMEPAMKADHNRQGPRGKAGLTVGSRRIIENILSDNDQSALFEATQQTVKRGQRALLTGAGTGRLSDPSCIVMNCTNETTNK